MPSLPLFIRLKLNLTNGLETSANFFQPSAELSESLHILYVQERDEQGNWSAYETGRTVITFSPFLESVSLETTQIQIGINETIDLSNTKLRLNISDGSFRSMLEGVGFTHVSGPGDLQGNLFTGPSHAASSTIRVSFNLDGVIRHTNLIVQTAAPLQAKDLNLGGSGPRRPCL